MHISKREGIISTATAPNEVDSTYHSINDNNVTYEIANDQIIVTYDNKYLVGKRINGAYWEEDKDGYKVQFL